MTKNEITKKLAKIYYATIEITEQLEEIKQEIKEMYYEIEKNIKEEEKK
jgi:predicted DNA-binding transcriptional regulator